jgi:mismatch-specific thymine-DNA glycosylase
VWLQPEGLGIGSERHTPSRHRPVNIYQPNLPPCCLVTSNTPSFKCHIILSIKMARTRSSRSVEGESSDIKDLSNQEQAANDDGEAQVEADGENESPPQATLSFNGKLQQFQYTNVTSTASLSGTAAASQAMLSMKRKQLNENLGASAKQSSSPAKKKRMSSKYAPPSKYAHLAPLTDILEPNLICVFVGFNPGVRTATSGHAYAHPSNSFWKLLHSSGLTDRRCRPEEDVDLPRLYAMGNTNIVSRPSKDVAELSKEEVVAGTPILDNKIRKYKPEAVCIVGKSIWEAIWQYNRGKKPSKAEFHYGWQDETHNMGKLPFEGEEASTQVDDDDDWPGARVFVATSTSGLSASLKPAEKEAIWKPFGEWVQQRREERLALVKE